MVSGTKRARQMERVCVRERKRERRETERKREKETRSGKREIEERVIRED